MRRYLVVFSLFTVLRLFGGIFGYDAIGSDGVIVLYESGMRDHALRIVEIMNRIREDVIADMGHDPGTVVVVLKNMGTYTNGFADPVLKQITVLTWPESNVWLNFNDWYETVLTHEFTHIAHLTNERGIPELFTYTTGIPLLNPQFRSPFVEATTVYEESKNGTGRLNNPFLSVGMVTSFSRGWRYSLGELALPSRGYFLSGVAHYLIPANFYSFLVEKWGEEKVREFFDEYSREILGLGLVSDFKNVFGSEIERVYREWMDGLETVEFQANPLMFKDDLAITDIDSNGSELYFSALEYGSRMLMGGTVGFVAKFKRPGSYEKLFDFSDPPVDIEVDGDRIYYLENTAVRRDFYTRRIVEFHGGRFSTVAQGDISAFDAKGGRVYWAEYDALSSRSTIFEDGSELFDVNGFVREIAVSNSGEIALLVSDNGMSSEIIVWDGDVFQKLNDVRFKYSLFWRDDKLHFLMFNNGFADLYHIDGGDIYRDTEGFILGEVIESDSVLYGTTFSKDSPSIGLVGFRLDRSEKIETKAPSERSELIDVSVEDIDSDELFVSDILNPDFRVPFVLWDGTDVSLGLAFGESSYDYSLVYVLAPMMFLGHRPRFGIYGVVFLRLGGVDLSFELSSLNGFLGFDDFMEIRAEGDVWREKFNPWSSGKIGWYASYRSDGRAEGGLNAGFRFGNARYISKLGVSMEDGVLKGVHSDLKVSYVWSGARLDLMGSLDLEEDLNLAGGLEVVFPMFKLDVGTLDPYFHVGWVYGGFGIVSEKSLGFRGFLGLDLGQFLTYSRVFVRLGFEYSDGAVSPYFDLGSDL